MDHLKHMDLQEMEDLISEEGEASLEMKGRWTAVERDPETGEVLGEATSENVITEDGADAIADMLAGTAVTDFTYIAVGNGPTAGDTESVTQSTLSAEQARKQDSSPSTSDDASGQKVTWSAVFGPGTCVVTEFGLLNSDSGGTLLSYNIPEIAKDADNAELTLTYELIVNEG